MITNFKLKRKKNSTRIKQTKKNNKVGKHFIYLLILK